MTNALVLLSGGLDSATTLAIAREAGFGCYAISFAYGQRHFVELEAAKTIAQDFSVLEHRIVPIDLSAFGGSALTDSHIAVPEIPCEGIPVTYVPARNTVFLSLALAWSEVLEVRDIFMGVNAVDYSGYPDCRPEFVQAFETLANLATRAGVEGERFTIHTPLIDLSKRDIIARGLSLGVDYRQTVSCYQPNDRGEACGRCESCRLRREGFVQSGVADPTRYVAA
ncbi:MAG: 7-cyano-7-deazaguanine synthase QueC [Gammaproteobacteria bacterium]|nr:7-cyano-7-deazaguanine synthase QueC [Gammaproteobacteria bacterium]